MGGRGKKKRGGYRRKELRGKQKRRGREEERLGALSVVRGGGEGADPLEPGEPGGLLGLPVGEGAGKQGEEVAPGGGVQEQEEEEEGGQGEPPHSGHAAQALTRGKQKDYFVETLL